MWRALCLMLLVLLPGMVDRACAATPARPAAVVRLAFHVYATLPAGSLVTCKAQVMEGPRRPVEEGMGTARVEGSSALCAAEVPLLWTGESRAEVTVRYEVDAAGAAAEAPVVLERGEKLGVRIGWAAEGRTVDLDVDAGR